MFGIPGAGRILESGEDDHEHPEEGGQEGGVFDEAAEQGLYGSEAAFDFAFVFSTRNVGTVAIGGTIRTWDFFRDNDGNGTGSGSTGRRRTRSIARSVCGTCQGIRDIG